LKLPTPLFFLTAAVFSTLFSPQAGAKHKATRLEVLFILAQRLDTPSTPLDQRIAAYSKAITAYKPGELLYVSETYSARAQLYDSKGDYKRAIADWTQAIRMDYTDRYKRDSRGAYHRFRGRSYCEARMFENAVEDFEMALLLTDKEYHGPIYAERGKAYRGSGNLQKAITDFTKAIAAPPAPQLAPNWEVHRVYLSSYHYERAITHSQIGDSQRALEDLNQAIKYDPSNAQAQEARR
jgi:tetratricopeptide (TPR) repeat protein